MPTRLNLMPVLVKAQWLACADVENGQFRRMVRRGEERLGMAELATAAIGGVLSRLDVRRLRRARAQSVRAYRALLGDASGSLHAVPFNAHHFWTSEQARALLGHPIKHNILVPLDDRYSYTDLSRFVETRNWFSRESRALRRRR